MKLFYCAGKVHSLKSEDGVRQVIRHDREVLVERGASSYMTWGDKQASVLGGMGPVGVHGKSYTVYGVHEFAAETVGLIGFSGYYFDALSTCYLLGNGYRSYSPRMMRFLSPDSLSPFDLGGLNAYGYCSGDPINRVDDNGRFWGWALSVKVVSFKVRRSNRFEVRRQITSAGGEWGEVKVAKLDQGFKVEFDKAPINKLSVDDMAPIKSFVLYRSMQNAKRAYIAGAVYRLDVPRKGMFEMQYDKVNEMVRKLRETGSRAEYQRAHTANMAKIDYWMAEMKKNRDAEAIRLGGLLKQPE